MAGGEWREGDWEFNGCGNRNYAFKSFCNRCKQLRILVDSKTPADSVLGKQWRDGDWMCTNCNSHNYASRSKSNKCNTEREGPRFSITVA